MIPYQLVWLIMLLPLFSFIINGLIIRPFVKPEYRVAGYITIGAIAASAVLSIWTLLSVMSAPHHELAVPDITWVVIENGVTIHLGLMVDSLTAVMLIVVTVVSLMVQIYSQGYMHGDPGYHRYFAFMSLFTFSMLGWSWRTTCFSCSSSGRWSGCAPISSSASGSTGNRRRMPPRKPLSSPASATSVSWPEY